MGLTDLSSGELSPLERSIPSQQLYRLVMLLTPSPDTGTCRRHTLLFSTTQFT